MKLWIVLSLAFYLETSFAQQNPLKDPNICGRPTCKDGGKFRYQIGTEHQYLYIVDISTLFNGTSKNESTLRVEGVATIDFVSECDGLLTLTDLKLSEKPNTYESSEHDNSKIFSEQISEYPLRFAFHDGVISEVCPYEFEKNWVLNFKKGLLSMLHNTMKRFDLDHNSIEDDVRGKCNTVYRVLGPNGTSLLIEKTKDLTSCQSRSKLHSMVQSTPYNFRPVNPDTSLLKSSSYCTLSIDHHIYNNISCVESHVFQPFSNQNAGATTIVKQSLTLIDEQYQDLDEQLPIERRSPLYYDQVPTPKPTLDELRESRTLIKKLCKLSTDDVQTEFSDLFTKFIHTTRLLSYAALSVLYDRVGTICPTGKKHVLDALPYLGSNAAVALMKNIIVNGAIPDGTVNEWMMSMALIPRPDTQMLEASLHLLQHKYHIPSVSLGVASLTYTFCMQNEDCTTQEAVDGIIQLLEEKVTKAYNRKKYDRKTVEMMIISLKALSNIGEVTDKFKGELFSIIKDTDLNVAVRVAAIETHRRFSCEEVRPYFEELFRNKEEDSELRIAAYLQVMRCPNYVVVRTIRHSLEVEEVNQVGSFIWSHLHNLLKSSIPSRVEIQGLLSDKDLVKKFNSDVRKFSHNYEGSVFFEEYNVGANYESNVIFSPSSYIPRSAMLNVTVDLFGESINMLEVYGRMEGFEHYVESIFGPKGPLNAKKFGEKLPKMRFSRNAHDNEALKSEINKFSNVIDNNFNVPKVALGLKIFGNELKYATFNGDQELKAALYNLNPVYHLKRILSGKEINYNKAAMFLDSSYVVPSGAGFPITLNAVGTAAINMKILGSLNATHLTKGVNLDLKANIQPNVALDIVGTMSVDAYFASTGIKLKTSLYTSSAVEGNVAIRGTKLVRVTFGLPKQTTEILGAKSELIVMKGSLEETQRGIDKNRLSQSMCTWPAVDKTIGLRLCADYHFTNVTDMKDSPSFILAGPSGFRLSLQKTDPTARTYFMEYKRNEHDNGSAISLIFDTPGASIPRLLSANLTHNNETGNLTLSLESTAGKVIARGKYKNTVKDKYLELGLDINNQKNFDVLLSLEQVDIKYGHTYTPKLYLGVNAERVAELQGTLKWVEKSGVSQCDVNLKFKTKRLTSKLFGYISKTPTSFGTNLKLDYKFVNRKEQTIKLDFSIANRSTRTIVRFVGDAQVRTTAYPNMNFNSSFNLQKAEGHTDLKFELKSSPTLFEVSELNRDNVATFQLQYNHRSLVNSTKIRAMVSLTRRSTDLDLKGQILLDIIGHIVNGMALVRYAKGKDIVVSGYWSHPRQTFENIEGRLNITVPSYSPMILEGRLREQSFHNYVVELKAVWFTGHNISMRGIYQDKSSVRMSNHHLKAIFFSPSFKEISADLQFYRDNTELKIDFKADHNNDSYEFFLKHNATSPLEMTTHSRLKYKSKVYSITSLVSLKQRKEITLGIHIDQLRDIHLAMWVNNKEAYKAVGFEVKWDANRDPNQKLAVTGEFINAGPYNYQANFMASYPGRTINGLYKFKWIDEHFSTLSLLQWNSEDSFSVNLSIDYREGDEMYILVKSELLTPFEDLRRTSLNGGIHHIGNMYRANGSVFWQHDQHISIDLFGDYAATAASLKCEFTGSLVSTVHDIPSLSASVKHSHNSTELDTNLHVTYHPKHVIDVKSLWQIDEDQRTKNLTGTVTLVSPFTGFNKGLLVSKIYVTSNRHLRGVADLDLDHRKFTASVEGHLQKLTKSMLSFNVTTPFEKYAKLSGRFGFSEEQRHLVAMITHPTGSIGLEVIFLIQSLVNFDVKFNLATPIEFLQKILIVGKLKADRADFRLGLNTLLAGFAGVWHYANVRDFEYSYKIYTPIEGLEENGIVAKLIFKEGLDFEVSIKLAENRIGVIIEGKPKPMILKELGIETQAIYKEKLPGIKGVQKVKVHEEDPFSWAGFIEIDTFSYPTMKGTIDIDQKDTIYDVLATLTLPGGKAEIRNEFDYINPLMMKNRLYLSTPYANFKTITSSFALEIIPSHQYLLALDFNYQSERGWVETGAQVHYIALIGQHDNEYNVTLHVHTPSPMLPKLDLSGALKSDDNQAYRANVSMATEKSNIRFNGDLKMRNNLLEADVDAYVKSPIFNIPAVKLKFKKDFSEEENNIKFFLDSPGSSRNKFNFILSWRYESIRNFKGTVELEMPFKRMEKYQAGISAYVTKDNILASANILLTSFEFMANATLRINEILYGNVVLDFNGLRRDCELFSSLVPISKNKRQINGRLSINEEAYDVDGFVDLFEDMMSNLHLEIRPADGTKPYTVDYQLQPQSKGYAVKSSLGWGKDYVRFEAHTAVKHKLDWDLHLQVSTSHDTYNNLGLHVKAETIGSNTSFTVSAKTPFEELGNPRAAVSVAVLGIYYHANAFYEAQDTRGSIGGAWSWIVLENMSIKLNGNYQKSNYSNQIAFNAYYLNPNKTFELVKVGGDVDLNKTWAVGSNLTLSLPGRNKIDVEANIKLSPPNIEVHTVRGKFHGNDKFSTIDYLANYRTLMSGTNYGSKGNLSYSDVSNMSGDVDVEWGQNCINNYLDLKTIDNVTNLLYKLKTPRFKQEALIAQVVYRPSVSYYNISGEVFYPGNRSVIKADVDFQDFGNTNGTVNVTTTFKGFEYIGANFNAETSSEIKNRYIRLFWPNETAVVDAKCSNKSGELLGDHVIKGIVLVEVPLTTRHIARVDYGYSKKSQLSTGRATVEYNGTKVLEGKYNCLSESRAGFDKDTIHVELENKWLPIGADYVHGYEYNESRDVSNTPTVDSKRLHVYNMHNKTALNVTGEMSVRTTLNGQQIALTAIHSNRTVKFWTTYDVLDQRFKQHSRLELDPTAWIAYDIDLLNKTTDETSEAQQIQINLSYPRRNFTAQGSYNISDSSLSSEVSLEWDKERKIVQAGFDWKRDENLPNHHEVRFDIKHPSFEKNVSFIGQYEAEGKRLADVSVIIDYSNDIDRLVKLKGIIENHSHNDVLNYKYGIWGSHPATRLFLDVQGKVFWKPRLFISDHVTKYSRTFDEQVSEAATLVDVQNNEIKFKRKTPTELSYLWGRYAGKFPLYTANVSAIYGNDINASGEFYLNFREKLVQLELNKTTDGSQSLHMYGIIPDARSAVFDIWRDYEDIRVSDVAYLLRLNHSRLVVSNLRWRPDLKQDIQNGVRSSLYGLYNSFTEGANNARQYIRFELTDSISGIWKDALPFTQDFLDDVKDLRVIEEDLQELKVFLNNSYHANEFYIRDVVGFLMYTFDELSIRSHIESLPAIVNEIWDVMGESGKKIQKSMLWVIEKIKSYYKNAADFISGLLQGDSFEHLSEAFKELLEKYDHIIKDMHVAFIRYIEDLWNKTYLMIVNNWHKTLAGIEPTFIKIMHYMESIAWNAGQEFVDFLYIRSEIMKSEYFNKFANFTHDLDQFYKDISGNDTMVAMYKYSKVAWNFIKQKYFELVPFARELEQIVTEIVDEITQLKNLPSIRFIIQKYDEVYEKVKWLCDYFDVQNRVHRFITLIRLKLTDMKQNALQAENRYREAKTKFIFEPADGIMYLEQKLPVSWHAFNETPKFDEIPEYKAIKDMQKYFSTSKITFASLYRDYKPFTDPSEWLPPFKAQAMLAGGQHYITFDRRVYSFRGECSYLLATDFVDSNFSIAVSYDRSNPRVYELLILIEKTLVHVNLQSKSIRIGNNSSPALPVQIGHAYLYQEADIVTLESNLGYALQCNMKFDVCMLEVSGWYFGKTAGLWGTMNNEPVDDLMTSEKYVTTANNVLDFARSWSVDRQCTSTSNKAIVLKNPPDDIVTLCESFFSSKVSPFITCFPRVPTKAFLDMCLESSTEEEACTSAIAYMKLCSHDNTPLRIPDTCVKCKLVNGTIVHEGKFMQVQDDDVPQSADIVFLVEAKKCNDNIRSRRKIDIIIEQLHKELTELNITQNRYSVVTFGNGNGVLGQPRSVVINSNVFAKHQLIPSYFDHIQTGEKGNSDIFGALTFATKLVFRPGVSKTFILLPCTDCHASHMELDYSIVHQLLLENDITLHILMNEEFQLKKTRGNKIFFGIDRYLAYTKKDVEKLRGDAKSRKELQLPKSNLGFCMPLALESSGSVFTAKKLETRIARKVAIVFAKRIATSAVPSKCKTCECTGDNTGVSFMECFPCSYPTRLTIGQAFDEDELLSAMQPGDDLNDYDYY